MSPGIFIKMGVSRKGHLSGSGYGSGSGSGPGSGL